MGSRRVLGSSRGSTTAGLEPDFGTGRAERERRQWLMLPAQLYCFSSRRLRLRRSLAATAPAASGGPSIRPWSLLWQAGAWREELIQLLRPLAERADRRLHPLPRPGPRPRPVPLGKPEHHHHRLPHRPAHHPPRLPRLTGAPLPLRGSLRLRARATQTRWPRRRPHRTVRVPGVCHLRKPRRRATDGVGESLWRLEREVPAAWLPVMGLAV